MLDSSKPWSPGGRDRAGRGPKAPMRLDIGKMGPILLWELAAGLAAGAIGGTIAAAAYVRANAYLSQGLPNAALYSFKMILNQWVVVALTAAAVVAVISVICMLSAYRTRTVALFVAVPLAVLVSYLVGYSINRFDFKPYWLAVRPLLGIPLRAAFFDAKVVLANIGVLAVSVGAGWVAYKLLRFVLGKLGDRGVRACLPPRPHLVCIPLAGVLVAFNVFCLVDRAENRPAGSNVILISLDTLRRDHLGCYGYRREVSPEIDRFAAGCVLFDNAVTQAGSTLSSHKSIMTSVYPPLLRAPGDQRLSLRQIALSEKMLDRGYSTAAFANGLGWVTPLFNFDQGFETYVVPSRRVIPKLASAEEITDLALSWLGNHAEAGFFLFLHYGDIHSDFRSLPYEAPEPYGSMFLPPGSDRFDRSAEAIRGSEYLSAINWGRYDPSPEEIEYLKALYDGGIRYTDYHLGRLFGGLENLGILDNTMVVILSDHGEEFREHGRVLHGWVYCEVARVPLLIRFPQARWAGTRVEGLVQLVDVVPTVLASAGIAGGSGMSGQNLADVIGGGAGAGVAFTEGEDAYSLRTERWMHLLDIEDGHRETYDLVADPEERSDLTGRYPDEEAALEAALLAWINVVEAGTLRGRSGEPIKMDRKTRELLKSLGYLQTGD